MTTKLQADFNGLFGDVLCLSHDESAKDVTGEQITLTSGMPVLAFESDPDHDGNPAFLVARGRAEISPDELLCRGSRWCLHIDDQGVRHVASLDDA